LGEVDQENKVIIQHLHKERGNECQTFVQANVLFLGLNVVTPYLAKVIALTFGFVYSFSGLELEV